MNPEQRWSHAIDRLLNSRYMEPGLVDLIWAFYDGTISRAEFEGRFKDGPIFLSERWPIEWPLDFGGAA